jgi:hypothetical protein
MADSVGFGRIWSDFALAIYRMQKLPPLYSLFTVEGFKGKVRIIAINPPLKTKKQRLSKEKVAELMAKVKEKVY